jgi:plastocyanin domain-containing protein
MMLDGTEIGVLAGGVAAMAGVLWYFFGARQGVRAAAGAGVQTVAITVRGGYHPDRVVVEQGTPVRLQFYRDETDSCSEQVVFPDFGISRDLPPFETTTLELTPERVGTYGWSCGMRMLRGTLEVVPRG